MPRKKELIPASITEAPLLKKTKIRRAGFDKYKEQMLTLFAPAHIPLFMRKLTEGLSKGDHKAIRLIAEMYGYANAPGGVTVNNQMIQASVSTESRQDRFSFESVVRQLQQQKEGVQVLDVDAEQIPG